MYNIQQIIDRYKDILPEHNRTVTGYLSLGGHQYYLINSNEPLWINSDGYNSEFITNELGQVQHYNINENFKYIEEPYFRDKEFTIPVTQQEIDDENLEYDYNYFRDFETENEKNITKWWGTTIDKYYIHPWYPNKKIVAFELIRLIPGGLIGQVFGLKEDKLSGVMYEREIFYITIGEQVYTADYCLQYPEFFKPNFYENV